MFTLWVLPEVRKVQDAARYIAAVKSFPPKAVGLICRL